MLIVEILERKIGNKNYEINFSKSKFQKKKYDHPLEIRKIEWGKRNKKGI